MPMSRALFVRFIFKQPTNQKQSKNKSNNKNTYQFPWLKQMPGYYWGPKGKLLLSKQLA